MTVPSTLRPLYTSISFAVVLLAAVSSQVALAQSSTTDDDSANSRTHLDLSSNACLKQLSDNDPVLVSIAFKDGADGSGQLKELVDRNPWGFVPLDTTKEIEKQISTKSPFLIITLTKKQALTLDGHRDIIRWTLVQSTVKTCE